MWFEEKCTILLFLVSAYWSIKFHGKVANWKLQKLDKQLRLKLQKLDYYDVEEYFVKLSAPAVRAYR